MSTKYKFKLFFANHVSRILSVQYVYQYLFIVNSDIDQNHFMSFEIQTILVEIGYENECIVKDYNRDLYVSIANNFEKVVDKLNNLVSKVARERPIEQIDYLTKSIWYVIATEVEVLKNVPPKVGIDEAIELDKELNAGKMYSLTNVILGKYFNL